MLRLLIVLVALIIIFFIFWNRNKNVGKTNKSSIYKYLIIGIIILGLLFFLSTSGRFIIPQLMNLIKIGLPFITKFIGI
tara:strand:+ start:137 stop:373 length:237 start_codon:yes stop_codon:yes gene_type:complete